MKLDLTPEMMSYEAMADRFDAVMNMYDLEKRVSVVFDEYLGDEDLRTKRVLDAGCGTGWFAQRAYLRGARVTAMDVGDGLLARVQQKAPVDTAVGDIMRMPFDDASFDYVVCSEVIEHVTDRQAAIGELYRVLRPGGVLVLTTPNRLWHFAIVIANRLGLRPYSGLENWSGFMELRHMLRRAGFVVERQGGIHLVPFVAPLLYPLLNFFHRWAEPLGPLMVNIAIRGRKPFRD
jgi:ubiquinone/menaquinone biosynthesis C-methylase UbiE